MLVREDLFPEYFAALESLPTQDFNSYINCMDPDVATNLQECPGNLSGEEKGGSQCISNIPSDSQEDLTKFLWGEGAQSPQLELEAPANHIAEPETHRQSITNAVQYQGVKSLNQEVYSRGSDHRGSDAATELPGIGGQSLAGSENATVLTDKVKTIVSHKQILTSLVQYEGVKTLDQESDHGVSNAATELPGFGRQSLAGSDKAAIVSDKVQIVVRDLVRSLAQRFKSLGHEVHGNCSKHRNSDAAMEQTGIGARHPVGSQYTAFLTDEGQRAARELVRSSDVDVEDLGRMDMEEESANVPDKRSSFEAGPSQTSASEIITVPGRKDKEEESANVPDMRSSFEAGPSPTNACEIIKGCVSDNSNLTSQAASDKRYFDACVPLKLKSSDGLLSIIIPIPDGFLIETSEVPAIRRKIVPTVVCMSAKVLETCDTRQQEPTPPEDLEEGIVITEEGSGSEPDEGNTSSGEGDLQVEDDDEEEEYVDTIPLPPLSDEDIQELLDQLLQAESEAQDAQETLEEESLAQVREEIRAELVETLSGPELDEEVEEEVKTFIEEWEEALSEAQDTCTLLQERLGEENGGLLPPFYKSLEKMTAQKCKTHVWRSRIHWAGVEPTPEVQAVLNSAEQVLKERKSGHSHHGKMVQEGASGFLERKLAAQVQDKNPVSTLEVELLKDGGWEKYDEILESEDSPKAGSLMGTKRWAAVYLASTPEQAALMGLTLPGVDSVEEIGDVENEKRSLFKAALASERERGLTERQKSSLKKVREEDDIKRIRNRRKSSKNRLKPENLTLDSQNSELDINHAKIKALSSAAELDESKHRLSSHSLDAQCSELDIHDKRIEAPPSAIELDKRKHIAHLLEDERVPHDIIVQEVPLLASDALLLPASATCRSSIIAKDIRSLKWDASKVPEIIDLGSDDELETERNEPGAHAVSDTILKQAIMNPLAPSIVNLGFGIHDTDTEAGEENVGSALTIPLEGNLQLSTCVLVVPSTSGSKRSLSEAIADEQIDCSPKRVKDEAVLLLDQDHQEKLHMFGEKQYRTTVVIDSEGEWEVEELLSDKEILGKLKVKPKFMEELDPSFPVSPSDYKALDYTASPDSETFGIQQDIITSPPAVGLPIPSRKRKARKRGSSATPESKKFKCTACGQNISRKDVVRHPTLGVGICKKCLRRYSSGPFNKDPDGTEQECNWCGEGGDLVCCDFCEKVFCIGCITRNFGQEELYRIIKITWRCFHCNDETLSQCRATLHDIEQDNATLYGSSGVYSDIELDEAQRNEPAFASKQSRKGKHRRNIRKVIDDDDQDESTLKLLALEKERQERLQQWEAVSGQSVHLIPSHYSKTLKDKSKVDDLQCMDGFVINERRQTNEEAVRIAPGLSYFMKPHQLEGVRFLWENCIESVEKVRSGEDGLGCILAHCMGLGKTMQVVTFLHTVLTKAELLGLRTALIVVPVNVLHSWRKEFDFWQQHVSRRVTVHMLDDMTRDNSKRNTVLCHWIQEGGVMLMGYAAFRNLSLGKHVKDDAVKMSLCFCLQNPGPDLLVCDEAHMIKNKKADITQVLGQVRTHRRIALTGSPMQNNLMEYYCMVDFVRQGFFGLPSNFKNRFQNPIENGQHVDSTEADVKLMKYRSYILHQSVKGFVQRKNMNVLARELPPKCVFVVSVRLSRLQRQLYSAYLQINGRVRRDHATESKVANTSLFVAYHWLAKVWNHPDLLLMAEEGKHKHQEDDLEDFIAGPPPPEDDRWVDEDNIPDVMNKEKGKAIVNQGRKLKHKVSREMDEVQENRWWKDILKDSPRANVHDGGKMVLLLQLIVMCASKGDKVLVFSQSLFTLDMTEIFLGQLHSHRGGGQWRRDREWYRLDGSTTALHRLRLAESFNDEHNTDVKCMLISTRAGSLGINLPAANRVIIVDGSWNPTHDLQAIYRSWRLGQKKPVYAYRLLACGTMEEKIYNRQVAKEGVAARVLDEHQVERHFSEQDLEGLFSYNDDENEIRLIPDVHGLEVALVPGEFARRSVATQSSFAGVTLLPQPRSKLSAFAVPKDDPPRDEILALLLLEHRPGWIVRYHEHEPLLAHKPKEQLTAQEQSDVWDHYVAMDKPSDLIEMDPTLAAAAAAATTTTTATTTAVIPVPVTMGLFPQYSGAANSNVSTPIPQCTARHHACFLNDQKVQVRNCIQCSTCYYWISWENLNGWLTPLYNS